MRKLLYRPHQHWSFGRLGATDSYGKLHNKSRGAPDLFYTRSCRLGTLLSIDVGRRGQAERMTSHKEVVRRALGLGDCT